MMHLKKTVLVLFIGILVLVPAPQPAHAVGGGAAAAAACAALCVKVLDPANIANEEEESFVNQVLNGIAWAAAKAVVQSITQSLVTWINSGFQGSPAFVTNLSTNLRQVADAEAVRFIQDLISDQGKEDRIDSPFAEHVAEGVAIGFYAASSGQRIAQRLQYTLQNFTQDPNRFLYGDFAQGGWNAWYQTSATCGNNIYCFRIAAHDELISRIEARVDQRLTELEQGRGFLSWRGDCNDGNGNSVDADSLSDEDRQSNCKILTPGSVIENQLANQLSSSVRQLELADSINEIIGALASQLVSQVIGGTGLLGTTESAYGGPSYIDSFNQENNNTNAQSTELINQLSTFETEVRGYRNNSEKVRTIAIAAKATLESCPTKNNNQARLNNRVNPAITDATAAITEADAVLPLIAQAKTTATTNTPIASQQYTELRARISPAEVSTAAADAIENASLGPSLYLSLQAMATSGCANSDEGDS